MPDLHSRIASELPRYDRGDTTMSIRCRLGIHRWYHIVRIVGVWECIRCGKPAPRCDNCGGQHNPTAFVQVCTVVSGPGADRG